jgi:hypothetical protein
VGEVGSTKRGNGEGRGLRWWYIANGLPVLIWNKTKKPLTIVLRGWGGRWGWETMGIM